MYLSFADSLLIIVVAKQMEFIYGYIIANLLQLFIAYSDFKWKSNRWQYMCKHSFKWMKSYLELLIFAFIVKSIVLLFFFSFVLHWILSFFAIRFFFNLHCPFENRMYSELQFSSPSVSFSLHIIFGSEQILFCRKCLFWIGIRNIHICIRFFTFKCASNRQYRIINCHPCFVQSIRAFFYIEFNKLVV